MKALPSTLADAYRRPYRRPYIRAEIHDMRRRWKVLYQDERDSPHAATFASPNLVRARIGDGGGVYTQTIPTPEEGTDFGLWAYSGYYNATALALCSFGARVSLFWADSARRIYHRLSEDAGLSWGEAYIAGYSASGAVSALGAGCGDEAHTGLFFGEGPYIKFMERREGVWSMPTSMDVGAAVNGIAVEPYEGIYRLLITADTAVGSVAWVSVLSASGYSALKVIGEAPGDSGVSFSAPALGEGYLYLSQAGRVYEGQVVGDFGAGLVSEPRPLPATAGRGLSRAGAYVVGPGVVLRLLPQGALQDVSPYVAGLRREMGYLEGRVSLVLQGVGPPPLGAALHVATGYYTSAGAEAPQTHTYFVEGYRVKREGGRELVTVYGEDRWEELTRWRARYAIRFSPEASVGEMVRYLLARAGIELVGAPSPEMEAVRPQFIIPPGGAGMEALTKLLELVPDRLILEGSSARLFTPSGEDEDYPYSGVTLEEDLTCKMPGLTHLVMEGAGGVIGEAFNWEALAGRAGRYSYERQPALMDPAQVLEAAEAKIEEARQEAFVIALRAPVNPALEVGDVIGGGRVRQVVTLYRPEDGRYEDEIALEGGSDGSGV